MNLILTKDRSSLDRFIPTELHFSKPKLIGLHAKARAGKDTVAGMLQDAFSAKKAAFADPIRDSLRAMLGLTDKHFFGSLKEVPIDWLGKSPRQLMQTLGTEWGRGLINEDIWLLIAGQKIGKIHGEGHHAVITDVRFENEASYIRAKGGAVWHILRDNAQPVAAHASEAGVLFHPGKDVFINNNGTLSELFERVYDAFEEN